MGRGKRKNKRVLGLGRLSKSDEKIGKKLGKTLKNI